MQEEKGNSKKTYLKMIREFLNIVYSSLYMGAGALCSTSVDLVIILWGLKHMITKVIRNIIVWFGQHEVDEWPLLSFIIR